MGGLKCLKSYMEYVYFTMSHGKMHSSLVQEMDLSCNRKSAARFVQLHTVIKRGGGES